MQKKFIPLGVIVAVLVFGGGFFAFRGGSVASSNGPVPTVGPIAAETGVIADAHVIPLSDVNLAFERGGTIAEVYVREGDAVEQGQALLKLDTRAIELRLAQAQSNYDLARSKAIPLEIEIRAAEVNLRQAQLDLEQATLVAPMNGTVAKIDGDPGAMVGAGIPVVVVADMSQWLIETEDLTELDVVKLREGDRANVTFDALPGVTMVARIGRIKPIGTNRAGDITYTVVLYPEQAEPRLRWNMTAVVRVEG